MQLDDSTLEKEPLTVMTYNVYVGADMVKLIGLTSLSEVLREVAAVYTETIALDFLERAAGIAAVIKPFVCGRRTREVCGM